MTDLLQAQGVLLDAVYPCHHHQLGTVSRYAVTSDCSKPAPGMLLRAADDLTLALDPSVLIGCKPSDTAAGRASGVRWTVLVESGHTLPVNSDALADHRCSDLAAAANWL